MWTMLVFLAVLLPLLAALVVAGRFLGIEVEVLDKGKYEDNCRRTRSLDPCDHHRLLGDSGLVNGKPAARWRRVRGR